MKSGGNVPVDMQFADATTVIVPVVAKAARSLIRVANINKDVHGPIYNSLMVAAAMSVSAGGN